MLLENFVINDSYLVRTSGTSDGTQDKYFKDDRWFKLDRYGGEGMAEYTASQILKLSGLNSEKFVEYVPCLINGKPGCYSENFLKEDDSFITLYRLYKNVTGKDLATVCSRMDYDDAIEYVINFVKQQTKLDIREYLANTFILDEMILNEDRHFNNLGIIYNGTSFNVAPIFDNGKSFLIGNKKAAEKELVKDKIAAAYSKSFSSDFSINSKYLKKWASLKIDESVISKLQNYIPEQFLEILSVNL